MRTTKMQISQCNNASFSRCFSEKMACSAFIELSCYEDIHNILIEFKFQPDRTAPGRFAPKPVPPETIPPGHFAQNFERDCSLHCSGTIRSKTNLRVDSPIFIIYMYIH